MQKLTSKKKEGARLFLLYTLCARSPGLFSVFAGVTDGQLVDIDWSWDVEN